MVPARDNAVELVGEADVLLVLGTSLQGHPAAGLVFEAPRKARRMVKNCNFGASGALIRMDGGHTETGTGPIFRRYSSRAATNSPRPAT